MQNKTRTITRLLAKALRERESGKARFKSGGDALTAARKLGIKLGEKIGPLPRYKRGPQIPEFVVVVDNFPEGTEHAYRPARFDRFSVEEWKEPKPEKKKKNEPEIAPTAEAAL
jgi:hypothetical protein